VLDVLKHTKDRNPDFAVWTIHGMKPVVEAQ
jgi:hypothetical protein